MMHSFLYVIGTQCHQHEGNGELFMLMQTVTLGQTMETSLQIVAMSVQIMVVIKTHFP